jgi:RHS repeat-associated protein
MKLTTHSGGAFFIALAPAMLSGKVSHEYGLSDDYTAFRRRARTMKTGGNPAAGTFRRAKTGAIREEGTTGGRAAARFNETTGATERSLTALKYIGHERDSVMGNEFTDTLDYMHARYYSASVGRFLSVDPALDLKKTLPSPQAWNRYAYVRNNPLRYIDPDRRLDYDTELLGRRIHVHIDDHLSTQRQHQLQGQVNASITAINGGQHLTQREMSIVKNIRSIDVNNSAQRSFVQERTGALTLTPTTFVTAALRGLDQQSPTTANTSISSIRVAPT